MARGVPVTHARATRSTGAAPIMSTHSRLGIVAGSGSLPGFVIELCRKQGRFLVNILNIFLVNILNIFLYIINLILDAL